MIGTRITIEELGWQAVVELIDLSPHPLSGTTPDQKIVSCARTSFMGSSKGDAADKKLLMRLYKDRHTSPFEMVQFTFMINAPLLVWWQLVRHRTFSINMQSGRYTAFDEDAVYVPKEWRRQSLTNKQGSEGVFTDSDLEQTYKDFAWDYAVGHAHPIFDPEANFSAAFEEYFAIGFNAYNRLLAAGVAREQARVWLPGFAVFYNGIVSIDAHNLMNFLRLRQAGDAQLEIRLFADAMFKIFEKTMPWTAEAYLKYKFVVQEQPE